VPDTKLFSSPRLIALFGAGNTNLRERLSTVDLLIKVGGNVKKVSNVFNKISSLTEPV
jgi:hypothetical protein